VVPKACLTALPTLLLPAAAAAGVMKLVHHELGPANPILQYMTPKVDASLSRVHSLTGVQLPVSQEQLSTLLFVAGSVELLGATLFTLNVKLGAVLLVSPAAGWPLRRRRLAEPWLPVGTVHTRLGPVEPLVCEGFPVPTCACQGLQSCSCLHVWKIAQQRHRLPWLSAAPVTQQC
jgi:hypothetical protein